VVEFKVGDRVRLTGKSWPDTGLDLEVSYEVLQVSNGVSSIQDGWVIYDDHGDWHADTVKDTPEESSFEQSVRYHTNKIADLLVSKNKAYGDSALNPVRIFSQASRIEQLNVRIDDKISRIQRGTDYGDEDTVRDLIGYLVLRLIAEESE